MATEVCTEKHLPTTTF